MLFVVDDDNDNDNIVENIPYCIMSDEFEIEKHSSFQILLYPKGFTSSSASTSTSSSSSSSTGYASAYLRYLPKSYGDEVDITYKLVIYYLVFVSTSIVGIRKSVVEEGLIEKTLWIAVCLLLCTLYSRWNQFDKKSAKIPKYSALSSLIQKVRLL